MANPNTAQSSQNNGVTLINKKIKSTNRHWKNFQDKNYLGSHNLEQGEEMLLTIARFEGDEKVKTADGEKSCIVIYFKEDVPKMILNVTNGNTIASLYGTHPDSWIDKKIQVYAANIKAFGKQQEALRIRDYVPRVGQDVSKFTQAMQKAKTLDELVAIWNKFPESARQNKDVIAFKDKLKVTLK